MNFGGNPMIQELLENPDSDFDRLLDIDSFPSQFRNNNPKLSGYMNQSRYQKLISYVTQLGSPEQKNRGYKYPLLAAEILSIDNPLTEAALLSENPITVEIQEFEERWVEKEVDQCDSQYCSSEGSNPKLDFEDMVSQPQQQNIPPEEKKERLSIQANNSMEIKQRRSMSSNSHKNSQKSITSDDFPMVGADKKVIKVKETIKRTTKKTYKPFLQQLFDYFTGEINHTLVGYISKVLQSILKKHPIKIIQYIFRSKIYRGMLKQIESYSVCDFIGNVIVKTVQQNQHGRQELLKTMINMSLTSFGDILSQKNYLYTTIEIINKLEPLKYEWHEQLIDFIYGEEVLKLISDSLFKLSGNSSVTQQIAFQLLLVYIKKISSVSGAGNPLEKKKEQDDEKAEKLKRFLTNKLQICFNDFINRVWDFLSNIVNGQQKGNPSSSLIIKAMEISNYLLRENLYWSQIQLSNELSAYKILCEICRKYPTNNLLHIQIFEVFKISIHQADQEPKLIQNIFEEKSVFSFLNEALHHKEIMYRGQVIHICHMMRNSHSEVIKNLREDPKNKWKKIQENLTGQLQNTNRFLGGFGIKKNIKPVILFDKQEILEHFKYFLRGEIPEKKKEPEESEEEIEDLTSSRGSCEWTDWNDFNNYNADEVEQ